MGGEGSTRWGERHKKKVPAEQCLALSIVDLVRNGFHPPREHRTAVLRWEHPLTKREHFSMKLTLEGDGDAPVLRLDYLVVTRGAKERWVHEIIELEATSPNYGGRRWWFLCPRCSRRCGKLYVSPDGDWNWACFHCHNLTYDKAQKAHEDDRGDPLKQFSALRQRLRKLDEEIDQCKRWSERKRRLVLEHRRTYNQLKKLMRKIGAESVAEFRAFLASGGAGEDSALRLVKPVKFDQ